MQKDSLWGGICLKYMHLCSLSVPVAGAGLVNPAMHSLHTFFTQHSLLNQEKEEIF
jgi:hypothetical protein